MGKTLLELLESDKLKADEVLSVYQKRYLRLMACRMLDGYNSEQELAIGVAKETFKEIKYTSATEAREDLEKLIGSYDIYSFVPELNTYFGDTLQTNSFVPTPFTRAVKETVRNRVFARLASVKQLGLLNLIYPTATHSRFSHSLGSFTMLCRYIAALYNDSLNPLFRQIMTVDDIRAALAAGLLHDLGQYPLAHDVEEADPQMPSHEEVGRRLIETEKYAVGALISTAWGVSVARVTAILNADVANLAAHKLKDRILHSLIDGPIDADKIDYLYRDSVVLGLSYGRNIDFDWFLRCLTVTYSAQGGQQTRAALGVHEKGKAAAEDVVKARYSMFAQVYWYHTYRAFKVMFHRIVWEALSKTEHDVAAGGGSANLLRERFIAFVDPANDAESHDGWSSIRFPLIDPGDFATLNWFAKHSGESGKWLFEAICARGLFKRVIVLSAGGSEEALLTRLLEFADDHRRDHAAKLSLQRFVQEEVIGAVREVSGGAELLERRDDFIARARRGEVLILVDIPPDIGRKTGKNREPIYYLVEEDRFRSRIDDIRVQSLEESKLWRLLQGDIRNSIGKVRVFCHPAFREFLTSSVTRERLVICLDTALRSAESK